MRRILLVIPSSTYRTHDFMAAASRLNAEVVVASDHRQAMASLVPDTTIALNFRKPGAIADPLKTYIAKRSFSHPAADAVIGVDDTAAYIAAVAARALAIPHNTPAALQAARNKYLMRQKIAAAGLNYPFFHRFSINQDPAQLSRRVAYPCVLKPVFLSASRGVTRADDPAGFEQAFNRIRLLLSDPEVASRAYGEEADMVLVEDYVPGVEIALEGILYNREFKTLAIFDKPDPLEGPHFVETIYVTPSRLPAYVLREATHAVERAALGLGLENGPVHAELRINDKGAFVIEIAARSIGGLCSRVLRFDGDITLEDIILRQALGEDIRDIQREHSAAAVMMIPIPAAGTLKAVEGIDAAKAVEGIETVLITIPTGQSVQPMPWGSRYLGFIFSRAALPEEAEAALREAHRQLHITIEETDMLDNI